jgi:membrane associated rhomboid family serine protease
MLCLLIALYYLLMMVLSFGGSPSSLLGFSGFSLVQLGATHGASILLGQYWRFVTSIFGHHDLLHIAFNLWALTAAGPVVEEIFDRKKMLLIYLLSGIASMVVSFVWYVYAKGHIDYVSAGASGAVSGMIGAALFGARRMGPQGAHIAAGMTRWAIYMVIWGFAVAGINNAAHAGGFIVGAAMARFVPLGIAKSVAAQRLLSVAMLGLLALFVASTGLMLANLRGFPASLPNDAEPRSILGAVYHQGAPLAQSDQARIWKACLDALQADGAPTPDRVQACELNVRANGHHPDSYRMLALLIDRSGDRGRASALRSIADRIR